jgi:hypothetical protein
MRTALNIAKFIIAAALFGFGCVIIVGFVGVLLEGPLEDPLWQHLLSVSFMGLLPILGAVLLFFLKIPPHRAQQAASPNGGPTEPLGNSGVSGGPPSVS